MSISKLKQVAQAKLPMNVSDSEALPELRVLMSAGLIAALRLRVAKEPGGDSMPMVRVLAITPDGRRLLKRSDDDADGQALAAARH